MPGPVQPKNRLIAWPLSWPGLLAIWMVVCAGGVRAAEPEVVPYDDALKSRKSPVERMLAEGQIPAGKEEIFDEYITKYALPQFVLRSNVLFQPTGNELRRIRENFRSKLFLHTPAGAARQRLLQLTLETFNKYLTDTKLGKSFAGDDVAKWTAWTAAKCNVILALGELNETESVAGVLPKPLPEALPILLDIAKPPAKAARGRDDSLRTAALIALEHHAENQAAPAETRTKIRDAMLAIVEQRKPPAGRDVAVNDYLRARAADVLALMKEVGPKNQVVLALDRIINDPTESIKLRGEAARALGGIQFPTGSTLDFKALADHIGRLVVDACKVEIERAQNSSLSSDARRRLKRSVRNALDGLNREGGRGGLITGATDEKQREFVKKVGDKLKFVDGVLDKDVNGEITVAKLAGPMKDLESVLEPRVEAADSAPAAKKNRQPEQLDRGRPVEDAEALAGSTLDPRGAK